MRPKKLFHAIVVVGATLAGGCGEDSTADAGADAAAVLDAGSDAGPAIADAGTDAAIADAAMDAATEPDDAGMEEDAMVLIL